MSEDKPSMVCLLVLDGWGVAAPGPENAISIARTPNMDRLFEEYPHTTLDAAGEAVGLPAGQMGNSEVGHLNLGAGRVVYQDLSRINHSIADGSFFENPVLVSAFSKARKQDSSIHLLGLLSDGGVHSDIGHLKALVEMARRQSCTKVFLQLALDGRDVSPTSGVGFLEEMQEYLDEDGLGEIATVAGRYYMMDRDHRWERTKLAYDAMVYGNGPHDADPVRAVRESYEKDITDEFFIPTVVSDKPEARIRSEDSLVFFNFRPDRARQLTRALIRRDFESFDRGPNPPFPYLVTMTEYDATFDSPIAFPSEELKQILPQVLSERGMTQLHIAETEKYAHVTFFFNGGVERSYPGEVRKLIPSPSDVPTYDMKPEMSAREVTDEFCRLLDVEHFDFAIINLANCDMVGHTGDIDAAVKAVEVVDECVGRIVGKVLTKDGVCLITADHGNAESMKDPQGGPSTAHTMNKVPLIVTARLNLEDNCALGDVAPTILDLLHIPVPAEMTGRCIISQK